MAFDVYIVRYGQPDRELVKANTTPRQAIRLLGSLISGKRRTNDLEQAFAIGQRFGWHYSQNELKRLVA
jgi:hypothetical protein